MRSPEVTKFFNIKLDDWNYPAVQPSPVQHRKGMLTHPAWLIAHAQNTETDPVKRGRWVQEKLLAGTVPDIPITVDAVIPEDHHRTPPYVSAAHGALASFRTLDPKIR